MTQSSLATLRVILLLTNALLAFAEWKLVKSDLRAEELVQGTYQRVLDGQSAPDCPDQVTPLDCPNSNLLNPVFLLPTCNEYQITLQDLPAHFQIQIYFDVYLFQKTTPPIVQNLKLEVQVGQEQKIELIYPSSDSQIGIGCVQDSLLLDIQNFDLKYQHVTAAEIIKIRAVFQDQTDFFFRIANVAIFANLCHWSCKSCEVLEDTCTSCFIGSTLQNNKCDPCPLNKPYIDMQSQTCVSICPNWQIPNYDDVCSDGSSYNAWDYSFTQQTFTLYNAWGIYSKDLKYQGKKYEKVMQGDLQYFGYIGKNKYISKKFTFISSTQKLRLIADIIMQNLSVQNSFFIYMSKKIINKITLNAEGKINSQIPKVILHQQTSNLFNFTIDTQFFNLGKRSALLFYAGSTLPTESYFWAIRNIQLFQEICQLNCQLCANESTCSICQPGYKSFLGTCVSQCPPYSEAIYSTCVDVANIYSFYLVKAFYSYEIMDKQFLSLQPSNQTTGNYLDKRILGGPLRGKSMNFTLKFDIPKPHFKCQLLVKLIFGDTSGQYNLTINLINNIDPTQPLVILQIQHSESQNQIVQVNQTFPHFHSDLWLHFQYATTYPLGFGALFDLFIVVFECQPICQACNNENECTQPMHVANMNLTTLQCLERFYLHQDMQGYQCLSCPPECLRCTDVNFCEQCLVGLSLEDQQCICQSHYFFDGGGCTPCSNNCLTCTSLTQCDSCNPIKFRWLQGDQCVCQKNYREYEGQCIIDHEGLEFEPENYCLDMQGNDEFCNLIDGENCQPHCEFCVLKACLKCKKGFTLHNFQSCLPTDRSNQNCSHCEKTDEHQNGNGEIGLWVNQFVVCQSGYVINFSKQCESVCGDGIVTDEEQCDDQNFNPFDGCYRCQLSCFQECEICIQGVCLQVQQSELLKQEILLTYCLDIQGSNCQEKNMRTIFSPPSPQNGLSPSPQTTTHMNIQDLCSWICFFSEADCLQLEKTCDTVYYSVYQDARLMSPRYHVNEFCGDQIISSYENCETSELSAFRGCFSCDYSCKLGQEIQNTQVNPPLSRFLGFSNDCECQGVYEPIPESPEVCQLKLECHYSCNTCSERDRHDKCLSCSSMLHRHLSEGECLCEANYLEVGKRECEADCHFSCQTCKIPHSGESCLSCSRMAKRVLKFGKCECDDSYFESNTKECAPCTRYCLRCKSFHSCDECDFKRTFIQGICTCQANYYDSSENCTECPYLEYSQECSNTRAVRGGFESCRDNNLNARDGCSNNVIQLGWSCVTDERNDAQCYQCRDQACLTCRNFQQRQLCLTCQEGYFFDQLLGLCLRCNENCRKCTNGAECTECRFEQQGECFMCSNQLGYYISNNECLQKCGDLIVTKDEECDDGNQISQDGCSASCRLEGGFTCSGTVCLEDPKPLVKSTAKSISSNEGFLVYLENALTNCSNTTVWVEGKDKTMYSYEITETQAQQNQTLCDVNLQFFGDLEGFEIAHLEFWVYPQGVRILSESGRSIELKLQLKRQAFHSQAEIKQAEAVQTSQNNLGVILAVVGPATLLLGGFDVFFNILDLMAWINNFYFLNVEYPLVVKVFFQYALWGEIELLQLPFQIMESKHEDYLPVKFQERGVPYLLMINLQQTFVILFTSFLVYLISMAFIKIIRRLYYNQNDSVVHRSIKKQDSINSPQLFQNAEFRTNLCGHSKDGGKRKSPPLLIGILFRYLWMKQTNFVGLIVKCVKVTFLDVCLSVIVQIQFYREDIDPLIQWNYYAAFLIFLPIIFILGLLFWIGNKPILVLVSPQFKKKYGEFYSKLHLNGKIKQMHIAGKELIKICFMYFLISLYDDPILQTSFCFVVTSLGVLPSLISNPYESRSLWIQNSVPELAICIIVGLATTLAIDEQTPIYDSVGKLYLGWIMLASIAISLIIQFYYILLEYVQNLHYFIKKFKKNLDTFQKRAQKYDQ